MLLVISLILSLKSEIAHPTKGANSQIDNFTHECIHLWCHSDWFACSLGKGSGKPGKSIVPNNAILQAVDYSFSRCVRKSSHLHSVFVFFNCTSQPVAKIITKGGIVCQRMCWEGGILTSKCAIEGGFLRDMASYPCILRQSLLLICTKICFYLRHCIHFFSVMRRFDEHERNSIKNVGNYELRILNYEVE